MRVSALFLLPVLFLIGCSIQNQGATQQPSLSSAVETPATAVTLTSSQQPTKAVTPTVPGKMPTVSRRATISPTSVAPYLPVPTQAISNQGPWGIIPAENGLWAMNADGSGLTRIFEGGSIIQSALSPVGSNVAFISHATDDQTFTSGFTLHIITAPDWKPHLITSLDLKNIEKISSEDYQYKAREAARALIEATSLAWSPDGRYLAFVGAQEGTSADVFVYVASTGEIRHLTDGPSQAYGLSWSPDSRNIFHSGANAFGTGAGANVAGAWVVSVDGKEVKQVMPAGDGNASLLGWVTKDIILVYSWNRLCGDDNLRQINLLDGTERTLWPGCMRSFVYDPQKSKILISNQESLPDINGNEISRKGTYLVTPGQDGYQKLSDEGYEKLFIGSGSAAWYGYIGKEGLFALERDGQVMTADTSSPYNVGRPADYFPDKNLFFYLNWGTDKIDIIKPGGEVLGTTALYSETFACSPVDPDLIFFTHSGLYAIRSGDWKTWLVSSEVEYGKGVYWLP